MPRYPYRASMLLLTVMTAFGNDVRWPSEAVACVAALGVDGLGGPSYDLYRFTTYDKRVRSNHSKAGAFRSQTVYGDEFAAYHRRQSIVMFVATRAGPQHYVQRALSYDHSRKLAKASSIASIGLSEISNSVRSDTVLGRRRRTES